MRKTTADQIMTAYATNGWTRDYANTSADVVLSRGEARVWIDYDARARSIKGAMIDAPGVDVVLHTSDTGKLATVLGWLTAEPVGHPRPGVDVAADHRPVADPFTERAEAAYPRVDADGRTVWACCSSSIGPACEHRPRVSLIKPYLTHTARAEALADLEAWDAVSQAREAYRWDVATRTHELVTVREINGALDHARGLGERASAVERANFHVLRANFPTLVSADYWLEIGPRTEVSDDLVTALRLMINGEVLDDERLEIERDDILRSAWDAFGWRALRDAADQALQPMLEGMRDVDADRCAEALERHTESARDYDTIADLGIDASEADGGTADFEHTESAALLIAARAVTLTLAAAR